MKRHIAVWTLGLGLAAAVGCAHDHVEEHFGESYHALTEQMIANPDAGEDTRPVEGLNANDAAHVTANYHERETFKYQDEMAKPDRQAPVPKQNGN